MRATRKARFITPALGEVLFWLLAGGIILAAFLTGADLMIATFTAIAVVLALRVAFELVLVIFACHEELERIRIYLESRAPDAPPPAPKANAPAQSMPDPKAAALAEKLERARQIDRERNAGRGPPAPGEHRLE